MPEEINKKYNPFKMWGSWIGLIFFLLILPRANFMNIWSLEEIKWRQHNECIRCGEPRRLDCVMDVCRNDQHYTESQCDNTNVVSFIARVCGPEYDKKPNKIATYFSLSNYIDSFAVLFMTPFFLFLNPVIFFLIGWGTHSFFRKISKWV